MTFGTTVATVDLDASIGAGRAAHETDRYTYFIIRVACESLRGSPYAIEFLEDSLLEVCHVMAVQGQACRKKGPGAHFLSMDGYSCCELGPDVDFTALYAAATAATD